VTQFVCRSALTLAVISVLALYGWEAHARRQVDPTPLNRADQAAYLNYARNLRESNYAVAGDRNRMPVFPLLLSLVYRPGMADAEFLDRAQSFNINLSILLLVSLFLILRRFFRGLLAIGLLMTAAFGVFVYRAGTVQVEPFYYFVGFCAFVLLLQMLISPRWWLGILAGIVAAIAYLTKASMLPALPIWAAVFMAQTAWECRHARLAEVARRLGQVLLVLGAFVVVVFPYERTSKRLYGHYFFNVNSAYYMWCDSWPEALAFTEAWRAGNVAPDQAPSLSKYLREHSLAQITQRFARGLKTLATRSAKPAGYYKFAGVVILAAIGLALQQPQRTCQLVQENAFAAAFCFLFFTGYLILYAWYDAVVTDSRFILSLFLSFIFVTSLFALDLGKDRAWRIGGRHFSFAQLFAGALIGLSLIDVAYNALRIARLVT
jgi:hypothetical protein